MLVIFSGAPTILNSTPESIHVSFIMQFSGVFLRAHHIHKTLRTIRCFFYGSSHEMLFPASTEIVEIVGGSARQSNWSLACARTFEPGCFDSTRQWPHRAWPPCCKIHRIFHRNSPSPQPRLIDRVDSCVDAIRKLCYRTCPGAGRYCILRC